MSKPFVLSVTALLRDDHDRCLILRRSADSKSNAGKWDFPGGKVDAGETFDVALRREIQEETGLHAKLEHVLGATESEHPDRRVVHLIFQARAEDGQVRLSDEHDSYKWVSVEALQREDICPQFESYVRSLNGRAT